MRLVFMGSPASVISPLKKLIAICEGLEHSLTCVVSQPAKPVGRRKTLTDPPLAAFAKEAGLNVLQPERASDPGFIGRLQQLAPDIIITASYGQILSKEFLQLPTRATINIHPSLLPAYRGATPVPAALMDGLTETGVTILFTVWALDAGNIICQRKEEIGKDETAWELTERLFELGGDMLEEALTKLMDGGYQGVPQDPKQVTLCKKIRKDEGAIDWTNPAPVIYNSFRALSPWPGSFSFFAGKRIVITAMRPVCAEEENQIALKPAEFIYNKRAKAIFVGTKAGMIKLLGVKPAGAGQMDAGSFWNGLKITGSGNFQ